MTASKTSTAKPVVAKPEPTMKWQDVEVNYTNRNYHPKKGSGVELSSALSKKQSFYRMVGRNLMVLTVQARVNESSRAAHLSRDTSVLGDRAALVKPTTRVRDLLDVLYGANKWSKATEAERKDYGQFITERDAFVEAAHAKVRASRVNSVRQDLRRAESNAAYYKKTLAALEAAGKKTVNK